MAYQIEVDFSLYLCQACLNRLAEKSNGTHRQKRQMKRKIANALLPGILICDRRGIWCKPLSHRPSLSDKTALSDY